jgi:hypothetical protein
MADPRSGFHLRELQDLSACSVKVGPLLPLRGLSSPLCERQRLSDREANTVDSSTQAWRSKGSLNSLARVPSHIARPRQGCRNHIDLASRAR